MATKVLGKLFWLDTGGVQWIYSPLLMLIPAVVVGHAMGVLAYRQVGQNRRFGVPPWWAEALYKSAGKQRFSVRPHKAAGVYFLLPLENRIGEIALTFWIVLALLLANVKTQPFIYFQF
jgi:hypothetical protein